MFLTTLFEWVFPSSFFDAAVQPTKMGPFSWDARSWIRSRVVETGRKALSSQPDKITLSRLPEAKWRNPASAERLAAPLLEKGFVDLGIYAIQPWRGYRVGVMLNERDKVAAFLNELPTGIVTLELSVRYEDGTTTALVNYANNGVPRPPFFRVIFAGPDASSAELYERLLRERPTSGIKTITADNVIAAYQAAYAKIVAYTKGMGLSAEQIIDIAARARQPATYIPSQKPLETAQQPGSSVPTQPAPDSGAKDIPCPHCGQINERVREVCWACHKLLSGRDKPVRKTESYWDHPNGPVTGSLREQLSPSERLLWHGRPRDRLDLRNIPWIALPLTWAGGLLFGGVGVALIYVYFFKAPSHTASWAIIELLFGLPFLMAGFYVLGGPFLQRFLRRGTFYAITDRRIIIVHDRPLHRVIVRDLSALTVARVLNETWDGWGDIDLGFDYLTSAGSDFEYIENVREVAGILHLARQEAAATPPSGPLAGDAPAFLAGFVVPLHYLAIALYLLLALSDLKSIYQTGGRILAHWAANREPGRLPSAAVLFAAVPVIMFFFYSRLNKFQAGTRLARTNEVVVMAVFVILGGLLLFWGGVEFFPKTLFYVILGVFALLMTSGRVSWSAD
jgi:hypothetical protein